MKLGLNIFIIRSADIFILSLWGPYLQPKHFILNKQDNKRRRSW